MKIEISTENTERATKLLGKFIELNNNSDYNYFDKDSIYIGENNISGYAYIYLESSPSISICLEPYYNDFEVIYSSGLDGIEFKRDLDYNSMEELENGVYSAYNFEDEIRGDDYEDKKTKEEFIKKMISEGWEEM